MEYRLEELFDLQMGKTPSRNNPEYWDSNDNKWISIADLSKCGKYIDNTKEYLSNKAIVESGISQIPANTVIMSFKLSIGKTAITSEPMYSNEAIMSFRDKQKVEILPDYFYYLLLAKDWDVGTNKAVMGKTLNKATLSKIKINIHDIEKQKEIVEVLDKISGIISMRQQELQKLDELVKARFVEMFGDVETIHFRYNRKPLSEVTINHDSTRKPVKDSDRQKMQGIYPYYGATGIVDYVNDFKIDGIYLLISEDGKALEFRNKDIAFIASGKIWVNNHAHVLQCTDEMNMVFLMKYMNLRDISDWVTGIDQKKLNRANMDKIPLGVPPIEQQNQFADFVNQLDKSKVATQKALDEAQLLFDSLMQEYFG